MPQPNWTVHTTIATQLLAAEAKAEALEETEKQAINRVQALEEELQQQVGRWTRGGIKTSVIYFTSSYRCPIPGIPPKRQPRQKATLGSQLAGSEKEKAALKAQLDEVGSWTCSSNHSNHLHIHHTSLSRTQTRQ